VLYITECDVGPVVSRLRCEGARRPYDGSIKAQGIRPANLLLAPTVPCPISRTSALFRKLTQPSLLVNSVMAATFIRLIRPSRDTSRERPSAAHFGVRAAHKVAKQLTLASRPHILVADAGGPRGRSFS
jgi:hypothetical protein